MAAIQIKTVHILSKMQRNRKLKRERGASYAIDCRTQAWECPPNVFSINHSFETSNMSSIPINRVSVVALLKL